MAASALKVITRVDGASRGPYISRRNGADLEELSALICRTAKEAAVYQRLRWGI